MSLPPRQKARLLRWAVLAGGLLAIEGAARAAWVRPSVLVPITAMIWRLGEVIVTGTIPSPYFQRAGTPSLALHLGATFGQVALSFALAVAVGVPAGMALWRFDLLARILTPYLVAYYAVPIFALYPLFILIFGLGILPIVLIGFLFGVVVIAVNTAIGFRRVDEEVYPKVGRSLRLGRGQMFRWIYLPGASPFVFTGLRLGFIYAMIGVIAAEFIVSTRGLGHIIDRSYRSFETTNMYAGICLVFGVALAANALLGQVQGRISGRFGR